MERHHTEYGDPFGNAFFAEIIKEKRTGQRKPLSANKDTFSLYPGGTKNVRHSIYMSCILRENQLRTPRGTGKIKNSAELYTGCSPAFDREHIFRERGGKQKAGKEKGSRSYGIPVF